MRIYISGPITGTLDFRERFNKAKQQLTKTGDIIINPVEVCDAVHGWLTHDEYMSILLPVLKTCQKIVMLPGWKQSLGARIERLTAISNEMEVEYFTGAEEDIEEAMRCATCEYAGIGIGLECSVCKHKYVSKWKERSNV